ncbi:hypothetical protein ABW19_dt0210004 [Dactylella cylindrospora]|nr:hypothetical protein ABW19_dt0210004 [Dactylella cylindrospora]
MHIKSIAILALAILPSSMADDSMAATILTRDQAAKTGTNTYDFIIVGGGTAGIALATRLGQKLSRTKILVLEAGPAPPANEPGISIPALKGSTLFGQYDWKFLTTPQEGVKDRVIGQSRGRILGGSTALNFMVWDRASKPEYDAWEEIGNHGWNWNNMLKYMLKVENYVKTSGYFGLNSGVAKGGPIQTTVNRIQPPQHQPFIPTLNKLGVPTNKEQLNGNPIGIGYNPNSIRASNYTRSWAPEYLWIAPKNVHVITDATVKKVNFKSTKKGLQATGVTLENGSTFTATREVILSAGSFQSPQLLELSGIGQPALLKKAGIKPLLDLPGVGENLQDHLYVSAAFQLKPGYTSLQHLQVNETLAGEQMALYQQGKPSLFDYNGSIYAFLNWAQILGSDSSIVKLAKKAAKSDVVDQKKLSYLTNQRLKSSVPQLEILFTDGYTGAKGYPTADSPLYGIPIITLLGIIMHPFSKGHVHIDPTNPSGPPVIDPNYLANQYDKESLTQTVKYLRKIASTAPLKDIIVAEYEPGKEISTDKQVENYAIDTVGSLWHPLGTCAMLPKSKNGVVDSNLKVYGTTNLRVVDASVIPVQLSAHVQTAVYGIAERAADLITGAWWRKVWCELVVGCVKGLDKYQSKLCGY